MSDSGFTEWHKACDSRDPRFDGVFYVGITSTRIYCRPICPSRTARPENRRFFLEGSAAVTAGFRACKRCRPELERGGTPLDAVSRLARKAAERISSGALNNRSTKVLAGELGASERHLRRALEREFGVSPRALAQSCRQQSAQRLLAETSLPVTQIAYESGYHSLRRFNAAFVKNAGKSPTEYRRMQRA